MRRRLAGDLGAVTRLPGGRERRDEVIEEIAAHLRDQYEEALAAGAPAPQAERQVLAQWSDWSGLAAAIERSEARPGGTRLAGRRGAIATGPPLAPRPQGARHMLESLALDLRFAARTLAARPLFTLSIVFLLAVGIGANTALFTVVNAVLLQPLPYGAPERLLAVSEANILESGELMESNLKAANFRDLREQSSALEDLAVYWGGPVTLTGVDEAEQVPALHTTNNLFSVLGVEPALGPGFAADPEVAANTVVLDHGFWQRKFGADPGVIGRTLTLDAKSYVVVGVVPRTFRFVRRSDLYVVGPRSVPVPPIGGGPDYENDRSVGYLDGIGRLRAGVSLEAAEAELERIGSRLAEQYPADQERRTFTARPLRDLWVGPVRAPLLVLLGAVGLVLFTACANVANLLLARAGGRRKELAVRAALGASRARVALQVLTESLALAAAGGLAGIGTALLSMSALRTFLPADLPRADEIGADPTVLAFALLMTLLTGVLFGVAPALQSGGGDAQTVLRDDARGATTGRSRALLRDGLVVGELALALVLLVGAGLMLRSFVALRSQDPGFDPDRIVTLRLSLPAAKYDATEKITSFYWRLLDELQALPGIESAATAFVLPFSGANAHFSYQVYGDESPDQEYGASFQAVSPGYFRTMGIPMRAGRDFTRADVDGAPTVAIVNEELVRRHFPDVDPLTQSLMLGDDPETDRIQIVGVVGNTRHHGYAVDPGPQVYMSFEQLTFPYVSLVVHSTADPDDVIASVRAKVLEIDPDQPVYRAMTLEAVMDATVAQPRFNAELLALFAAVALVLAAVGVFGVISYAVSQRTHELGIRMALGADHGSVLGMVMGHGLVLTAAGIGIGLAGAVTLSRLAASLWFGIGSTDPLVFIAGPALLAAVALLATYLPARRATRVDPVVALRSG